jgi:hypothetical protein
MPADKCPPHTIAVKAARAQADKGPHHTSHQPPSCNIIFNFGVNHGNMVMIYMSPDLYFDAFEQPLDLRKFDLVVNMPQWV